jgi:hypothetical protein
MTKIEIMENTARFIGYCSYTYNTHDWVEVIDEGNYFLYYCNGVQQERDYVEETLPFNIEGFEDGRVPH